MPEHPILLGQNRDGSYLKFNGSEHVALHARSGAGKTSGFTIPNCFAWQGSLIVLDIKGEIWDATAGHRAAMRQDVYLLDPAAEDGRSHRWDPLAAINRRSIDRFDQISRQAHLLFPEAQGGAGSNADKFWEPAGRAAVTAVMNLLTESPSMPLTMANVLRVFTRGDGHEWLERQIACRRTAGTPYSMGVVDGVSDYLNGEAGQVNGIRKTVSTRLQVWMNPRIASATSASDFDVRDIRRRPMSIYLRVAPGNIERMRPFLRLFFDQLLTLNSDKTPAQDPSLNTPVLLMLDEFARLGHMAALSSALQYVRGYGIRVALVIQNKAQIRAIYGKDGAADIFDNLGAEAVYATTDNELAQELEKRLGDDTIDVVTKNRPRFWAWAKWSKQSEAEHPHRRPLMLAQELGRLPDDEQVIIRPGMLPMRVKKMRWYADGNFNCRVMLPPEVQPLEVHITPDDGTTKIVQPHQRSKTLTSADVDEPAGEEGA